MKIVVRKGPLMGILRGASRLFFAAAVLLLSYCGFVVVDAWSFQRQESRILHHLLMKHQGANDGVLFKPAVSTARPPDISSNGLIGRIEIPRLGLSSIVMEGIGNGTLRRAVGHIPGTTLPGAPGNIGISGHRDTYFRPLRSIRENDTITLTTLAGEYRYRVVSTKVVSPDDVAVLDPSGSEILTLVTCHPFYFVGSAPERFIVRAERVN